ncbi:MAG: hypothetical protein AAGK02_00435 [Pseudomonadota bacterium]
MKDDPTRDQKDRALSGDPDALTAEYGAHLSDDILADDEAATVLGALLYMMTIWVDAGFSVKAGDKFTPTSETGMDDVLDYMIPEKPAPETPASQQTDQD